MLPKHLAVPFIARLSSLLVNAQESGIIVYSYSTLDCNYATNEDHEYDIFPDDIVTDGTCTSLIRKNSVAFEVSNVYQASTSCRVQIYPPPASPSGQVCSGSPVEVGGFSVQGATCYKYEDYTHYTVDSCNPSVVKQWEDEDAQEEAQEKAHKLSIRAVVAGTVVAVAVGIAGVVVFVVFRARRKKRLAEHGKVVQIELEERER